MRKILYVFLCCLFLFSENKIDTFADAGVFGEVQPGELAMTVTPVRYELTGNRGGTITKPITIYNYSKFGVNLEVSFENFLSEGTTGTPKLIPSSEVENPEAHMAYWMSVDTPTFSLASGESKQVYFTVHIPNDATPGGHYGAVLFNYTLGGAGTNLGTARRIGVLALLTVSGEVVVDGNVPSIVVTGGDGGGAGASSKDNTIGKAFSSYVFTALKKVKQITLSDIIGGKDNNTSSGSTTNDTVPNSEEEKSLTPDITSDPIDISITFENDGNTHIKPSGKIVITDENGEELKGIGKKIVKNEADAFVGEQVVDYLPINDQGGNVLPGTKRIFDVSWQGFPYETINEKGEKVIKFKSLSDYYTELNMKGRSEYDLHFWEQLKTRIKKKNLTANITVVHQDKEGKDVEFNSAKEISVSYKENYIGLNVPVVTALSISALIILIGLLKGLGGAKTGAAVVAGVSSAETIVKPIKKSIVAGGKSVKTYYDILDIKKSATKKEIDTAYKHFVKKKLNTKEVERAYTTLSDKTSKEKYDKKIKRPL